jgi:soluble lytic murein transglycosylase-like protein
MRLPASASLGAGRPPAGIAFARGIPLALACLVGLAALHAVRTLRPTWAARVEGYLATAPIEAAADPPPSAAAADPRLALFTPEVRRWSSHIQHWASAYGLPPELVATVMQIESCGAPGVRSPAGAAGLFQVMPFHFDEGEDPLDVETNAARGLAYLASGLELAGGRIDLALAGYNGGHGLIDRDPATWPDQTRRYVHWGTAILNDAALGRQSSAALQAWLDAGGAHVCARAAASGLAAY